MSSDSLELAESAPLALVVEDDHHAANIARDMLRLLGYRARIAPDAHQALYALAEGPPSLVLLDVCLPEMDGVGLMRVMRRVEGMSSVPVVAASAIYPSEGPVARVLAEQGVTTYLSKPFMLQELRRAIDEARSAAMKHGPPPAPTMTDGKPKREPEPEVPEEPKPAPVAAAPPPADPEPTPAPEPPKAVAPHAAAPSRPRPAHRGNDSAEFERPSPWGSGASGSHPLPTGSTTGLAIEVVGHGQGSGGPVEIVFVSATRERASIRTVDRTVEPGETLRVEMGHRIPVEDAMTDVKIRLLLRVTDAEDFGRGSKAACELSGAQPRDHFRALVDWFQRR